MYTGVMNRRKNLAIAGGILWLLPFFIGHGPFRLYILVTNFDKVTPENFTQVLSTTGGVLVFLTVGLGLIIYGVVGRKKLRE